jgi:predicted metal-dependent phosphoesterase TrpH
MTDHNTLQSVKEAQKIITEKKLNFTIANGIEISL